MRRKHEHNIEFLCTRSAKEAMKVIAKLTKFVIKYNKKGLSKAFVELSYDQRGYHTIVIKEFVEG